MRSVLDDELLYLELEKYLAYALKDSRASTGETDYIKQDFYDYMRKRDQLIGDSCFTLNYLNEKEKNFTGLVSLCNSTISGFSSAVSCGKDSILFAEESSVIFNRGRHAILCEHPRFVKIAQTSFLKCEGNAICISQVNPDSKYVHKANTNSSNDNNNSYNNNPTGTTA
jgi:hypothetical protein